MNPGTFHLTSIAGFTLALLLLASPALAVTVVLEPLKDASIKEDGGVHVGNGSGPMLFTGRTGNDGGELPDLERVNGNKTQRRHWR